MKQRDLKEERRSLVQAQYQSGLFLDRWLLTLSAGVFSLSIVFVRDIVGKRQPESATLLVASWIAFCLCIVSTLVSYLLSYYAYSRQIDITEQHLPDRNPYRDWMTALNIASVALFCAAIACLAVFAAMNLL